MKRLPEFRLQRGFGLYVAALALTVPLPWLAAAWTAAAVHELFHLLALLALGHPVYEIRLGVYGARMRTEPLPPGHECVCALAGPFGALPLLILAKWMPLTSLFGAVYALFNLLPLYPMDGGRALTAVMGMLGFSENVCEAVRLILCGAVFVAGIKCFLR